LKKSIRNIRDRFFAEELRTPATICAVSRSLQALADEEQIVIKVEHRLFSFISSNWRATPLRDHETIVRLIARTCVGDQRGDR